jgi:urease accessory protein
MRPHLPLLVWLSPAFPVGAFAYSHGLEWAYEAGDVTDAVRLEAWLADLLAVGAARNDAILFAEAYRAVAAQEAERLASIAELAVALASAAERRLETVMQGDAFIAALAAAWPSPALDFLRGAWRDGIAYPVAVATAAAAHAIPLTAALEAFALAFLSNLVSAAVRLGILGQSEGQRVIAALIPAVEDLASFAVGSSLDDLGGAAFRSDLAALRHETQYTRLFRS